MRNCHMRYLVTCLILLCTGILFSQPEIKSQYFEQTYKQGADYELKLTVYPALKAGDEPRPAIVFFFGGGWVGGSVEQFRPHAEYFSSRGMVAILADYRTRSKYGTTPFDALADARDALKYIHEHASSLDVDPARICAAGGSAGGHLAAATAMNLLGDGMAAKERPDVLILFNPVVDNGPNGYGYDRVGDRYHEFSPLHNITPGMPPALFFLGTKDRLIPVSTGESYCERMQAIGSRCDLYLYTDQGHGFFNYKFEKYYRETVYTADQFLRSIGYLEGKPTVLPMELVEARPLPEAHAHNDYRQVNPLTDALAHGFCSVEADLLLKDDQLYVGHDRIELEEDPPLLDEAYLEPLFRRFNYYQGEIYPGFDGTFYLWLDIKYDGDEVYSLLKDLIEPYREMLSFWDGTIYRQGKVTIVLSGDRPFDEVQQDSFHRMFLDGRPENIGNGFNSQMMPFISTHYRQIFTLEQGSPDADDVEAATDFVKQCHAEGKKVRFWATPDNSEVWSFLRESDVDLINTDSLSGLHKFLIDY